MNKVIECVPNFSEGQRKEVIQWTFFSNKNQWNFSPKVIDTIAHAIAGVDNVALLDIDPGLSTNRTIYSKSFMNSNTNIFFCKPLSAIPKR